MRKIQKLIFKITYLWKINSKDGLVDNSKFLNISFQGIWGVPTPPLAASISPIKTNPSSPKPLLDKISLD